MQHPEKWRETADPFDLPLTKYKIKTVLGYPHAGNDVFHMIGEYNTLETEAYLKIARQTGADIENEVKTIQALNCPLVPEILEYDPFTYRYVVTRALPGDRLSAIVGNNENQQSLPYLSAYGKMLAILHCTKGDFPSVKDRRFFHVPSKEHLETLHLAKVHEYLTKYEPKHVSICFCHGDFHYANILWENEHISAILDFELSGMGIREFDIAWALILRPGQKFLNTDIEYEEFKRGYLSKGNANWDAVTYYMVLIYCYFLSFEEKGSDYFNYVLSFINKTIK